MGRAITTPSPFEESRASRLGKRAVMWFILLQLPIGALSSYRAWVQIKELTLTSTSSTLAPGVVVRSNLVSWARVESDARIELVQGQRIAMLDGFEPGTAMLRATAVGRPQWLRIPPPTVREQPVTIAAR